MSAISKADKAINRQIRKSRRSKRVTPKKFFECFFTYLGLLIIAAIFLRSEEHTSELQSQR